MGFYPVQVAYALTPINLILTVPRGYFMELLFKFL